MEFLVSGWHAVTTLPPEEGLLSKNGEEPLLVPLHSWWGSPGVLSCNLRPGAICLFPAGDSYCYLSPSPPPQPVEPPYNLGAVVVLERDLPLMDLMAAANCPYQLSGLGAWGSSSSLVFRGFVAGGLCGSLATKTTGFQVWPTLGAGL